MTRKYARNYSTGGQKLTSMTVDSNTYYYMADGLGSARNVVESDEDVASTYDYRTFGILITETEGVDSPFEFTGREREPGGLSHMHYYRNRYYMPGVGIFTSGDEFEYDKHRGWGYVYNVPTRFTDPMGKGLVGMAWACAKCLWGLGNAMEAAKKRCERFLKRNNPTACTGQGGSHDDEVFDTYALQKYNRCILQEVGTALPSCVKCPYKIVK